MLGVCTGQLSCACQLAACFFFFSLKFLSNTYTQVLSCSRHMRSGGFWTREAVITVDTETRPGCRDRCRTYCSPYPLCAIKVTQRICTCGTEQLDQRLRRIYRGAKVRLFLAAPWLACSCTNFYIQPADARTGLQCRDFNRPRRSLGDPWPFRAAHLVP